MEHLKLNAQMRDVRGKAVRHLRRDGFIPVIVYGGALEDAMSLQVSERELSRALNKAGASALIDIEVDGRTYPVLARSVQRHPMRHTLLHVDFLSVRLDRPIQANIPVVAVNESPLVERGEAILVTGTDTVSVEALPERLPPHIDADLSILTDLDVNILARDLILAEGVTLVTDPETVIFAVTPPALEVVEEPAEAAAEDAEDELEVELDEGVDSGDAAETGADE